MTIPAPALRQFVKQVQGIDPEVQIEYGDIDGIDRYRSVTFKDDAMAAILPNALTAMRDERIAGWTESADSITVTVVPQVRADFAYEFELEEAIEALREIPKGSEGNPYNEADAAAHNQVDPPAAKRAARKRAPKG